MTKVTTAMVIVGPSGVGPFHVPGWRVGEVLQLVEGGHAGPFWLHDALGARGTDGASEARFIGSVDARVVAASLVDAVGEAIGEPQVTGGPAGNAAALAGRCRIGVVRLDPTTLLDDLALDILREVGLTVDLFDSSITTGSSLR